MKLVVLGAGLLALTSGCAVGGGGHTSDRGWLFWPLSLFLLMIVGLIIFRRRK